MINTEEVYNAEYCERINAKEWRPAFLPSIVEILYNHFRPESVLDVGCSNGLHLKAFRGFGVENVHGIEGTIYWIPYMRENIGDQFSIIDLRRPISFFRRFDLVISFEVLEHLERDAAVAAVGNVTSFGDTLCITTNPKRSKLHLNAMKNGYWIDLFKFYGFCHYDEESEFLMRQFEDIECPVWFKENLKVFRKDNSNFEIT